MIRRFNRLLFILIVVAATLYVAFLNQQVITIRLLPDSPIAAQVGIIIISTFVVGMLAMSMVTLWLGLQSYIRERAVLSKERERQQFYQNVIKARSHAAAEEWAKARNLWEQAIRKDPTHIIARVELSKAMQTTKGQRPEELLEALRTLDEARAKDPKNIEVLFRAAELNLALDNKTSALDNLALIIYEHPVKRALVMARNISEDLERYQDALEYHKKLQTIGEEDETAFARLKFKQLLHETRGNRAKLHEELKSFIKRNPAHAPAIEKLAEFELQQGKLDEAAQLYVRAAKLNGSKKTWQKAARIWVKNNLPDKAVAAARSLAYDAKGERRLSAEIELIRLFIALNMLDEAKKHCEGFMNLIKEEAVLPEKDLMREFLALKGVCYSRMGDAKTTTETLKQMCEEDYSFADDYSEVDGTAASDAPAPRLSTP